MYGGDGEDTVYGGAHNDTLDGGADADFLFGGTGNDSLFGGSEGDHLDGGAGDDLLIGGDGDDFLDGGPGGDLLAGGRGSDHIDGGAGTDIVDYADANDPQFDAVTINLELGTAVGAFGTDTIVNVENAKGTFGDDVLIGDGGDNYLFGRNGSDLLNGGGGDDILFGGRGASDTFVFEDTRGAEADIIADFFAGSDKIDFTDTEFFGFNDLTNGGNRYMEQVGADTVIHYYDHTITLLGVDSDQLSADDFLFA